MKLTKASLIKRVKPGLSLLGYTWFKDTITGCDGLFVKQIPNNLFLSIGMIIHRFYDDKYTCDYYLSTTTCLNCLWGDIPNRSSKRPGELLSDEEIYPLKNHDLWWSGDESTENFISVIKHTEAKIINDHMLIDEIKKSKDVQMLSMLAKRTISRKDKLPNMDYHFIPNREIDDIPMEWFKAAESVLADIEDDVTLHQVKRLAGDAFRQNKLVGIIYEQK